MITLTRDNLTEWASLRKMTPEEILNQFEIVEDKVTLTFEQATELGNKLNVSVADLIVSTDTNDLDKGIKIARDNKGYKRTSVKNGKEYYTYNHLVTTNAYPTLMPLRVEMHVNDEDAVILNGGHDSTEIVYVTKGKVRMNWEYNNAAHQDILEVGDSAYIHPGISHSFTTYGSEEAELIAINW